MTGWRIDMARRNVSFYLLKLVRISGWVLFLLMLVYIATGYALCGEFGFARLIDPQTALRVHNELDIPLVVVFLGHCLPSMYLAFRRWGWVGRKKQA